jgi:hypothetical protein
MSYRDRLSITGDEVKDIIANEIYKTLSIKVHPIYANKRLSDVHRTIIDIEKKLADYEQEGANIEEAVDELSQVFLEAAPKKKSRVIRKLKKLRKGKKGVAGKKSSKKNVKLLKGKMNVFDLLDRNSMLRKEANDYASKVKGLLYYIDKQFGNNPKDPKVKKVRQDAESAERKAAKRKKKVDLVVREFSRKQVKATPGLYKPNGLGMMFIKKLKAQLKSVKPARGQPRPIIKKSFFIVEDDREVNRGIIFSHWIKILNLPKTEGGVLPEMYIVLLQRMYAPSYKVSNQKRKLIGKLTPIFVNSARGLSPLVSLLSAQRKPMILKSPALTEDIIARIASREGVELWKVKINRFDNKRLTNLIERERIKHISPKNMELSKDGSRVSVKMKKDNFNLLDPETGELSPDRINKVGLDIWNDLSTYSGRKTQNLNKGLGLRPLLLNPVKLPEDAKGTPRAAGYTREKGPYFYWDFAFEPRSLSPTTEDLLEHPPVTYEEEEKQAAKSKEREAEEAFYGPLLDKFADFFQKSGSGGGGEDDEGEE